MYCRYSSAILNAKLAHFITAMPKKKDIPPIMEFRNKIEFRDVGLIYGKKSILC